jgi:hypothetical protein
VPIYSVDSPSSLGIALAFKVSKLPDDIMVHEIILKFSLSLHKLVDTPKASITCSAECPIGEDVSHMATWFFACIWYPVG